MGLTMSQRQAVTKTIARRYQRASKVEKGRILDELCATTGWHRSHARKALKAALRPRVVKPRPRRPPMYGGAVIEALRFCWAVLGAPAGKRMAPFLAELVVRLRLCGELRIDDATAAMLSRMSASTIDRRLAGDRAKLGPHGKSHTKPGSLLKGQIPIRTWAEWDEDQPGFVEIDLVGHEGGNSRGEFCFTLTVTDIATGWTENRSVRNKAQKWVFAALLDITTAFPFPIVGIDSDNGSEFINDELLRYCTEHQITFTRSRPGNKNDGAHVEQKNWAVVRQIVGYHRYDTPGELALLNQIWVAQSDLTNFFYPQQKLVSKQRIGAKVIKKYDTATTPAQRAQAHEKVTPRDKSSLDDRYQRLNPAAAQRHVQALTGELLTLTTAKKAPTTTPAMRALPDEATNRSTRAS
jgi:Integrase core domain